MYQYVPVCTRVRLTAKLVSLRDSYRYLSQIMLVIGNSFKFYEPVVENLVAMGIRTRALVPLAISEIRALSWPCWLRTLTLGMRYERPPPPSPACSMNSREVPVSSARRR